jgi:hypothetical protein
MRNSGFGGAAPSLVVAAPPGVDIDGHVMTSGSATAAGAQATTRLTATIEEVLQGGCDLILAAVRFIAPWGPARGCGGRSAMELRRPAADDVANDGRRLADAKVVDLRVDWQAPVS